MSHFSLAWLTLKRRWAVPTVVFCVAAIGVGLIIVFSPTQQQASATLFIRSPDVKNSASAYQGDLFTRQRIQTYRDFITSPDLARMVIKRLNLEETPQQLVAKTKATAEKDTVLLTISVTDKKASHAADIANGYATEFPAYLAQLENADRQSTQQPLAKIVSPADRGHTTTAGMLPSLLITVGILFALIVSVALVWFMEFFDRHVRTRQQLESIAGAPVLGTFSPASAPDEASRPTRDTTEAIERLAVNLSTRIPHGAQSVTLIGIPAEADAEPIADLLNYTFSRRSTPITIQSGSSDIGSVEFTSSVAAADGVVLVCVAGVTSTAVLGQAVHEIGVTRSPIIGVIANRSRQTPTPTGIYR